MEIQSLAKMNLYIAKRLSPGHPVFVTSCRSSKKRIVIKADRLPDGLVLNEARFTVEFQAELYRAATTTFASMRLLKSHEVPMLVHILPKDAREEAKQKRNFWYVMDALEDLHDLGELDARDGKPEKSKAVLRLVQSKPDMMQELGRIAVVDIFVGNNDRFSNYGQAFEVANWGNIFIMTNKSKTQGGFTGIDFFDPASPYTSLFKTIGDQINACGGYPAWHGDCLRKGRTKDRDAVAAQIIAAFNTKLQPSGLTLGPKHQKAFRQGMSKARPLLKKALKERKKGKIIPVGLKSRMKRIGW